jgi:parallel beta-helix repeat protein
VAENNLINNTVAVRLQGPNHDNALLGNVITGATRAIQGQYSNYNTILQNNISQNGYGFYLDYSTQNTIWGNNVVDNDQQAYVSLGAVNTWDNGYPIGGNYWSNYTGVDLDHDGIGDVNHTINAYNVDKYPLMGAFFSFKTSVGKNVDVVSNSTVDGFLYEPSGTIRFHVSNNTANQTCGFCRVSIPYEVLSGPFNVTIDGANPTYWNYNLYDNGTHRWIYFEYEHSTREVVIIPEFPFLAILPLFTILMLLAALVAMKKTLSRSLTIYSSWCAR